MPTIVFVHLNSPIPRYLHFNLAGMAKLFPDQKIVLIHNLEKNFNSAPGVTLHKFEQSKMFLDIEQSLSHPKNFRNNFWFTAIGRFEALHQYMRFSGEKIIHVESDVILAADFPFDQFEDLQFDIAFPLVARNRGVASTLFIRNVDSARELVNFSLLICQGQPDTSDMEILSKLVHNKRLRVLLLPISYPGKDSFHEHNNYPDLDSLETGIKYFGGIFDGNDIGVYLFGSNPRNSRGISTVGREVIGNFATIRLWQFNYNPLRKFVELKAEKSTIPVYSIHATCKKLSLFWLFSRSWNLRRFHSTQTSSTIFYPNIFLDMAISKLFTSYKHALRKLKIALLFTK